MTFAFWRASIRWLRLRSGAAVCLVGELAAGVIGAPILHGQDPPARRGWPIRLDLDLRSTLVEGGRWCQAVLQALWDPVATNRQRVPRQPRRCLPLSVRAVWQSGHSPAWRAERPCSNRPIPQGFE